MQNPARNRGRTWQWIIGFIVVVLLVWGVARLLRDDGEALAGRAVGIAVVAPDPSVPVDPLDPGDIVLGVDTVFSEAIPVAAIVASPEAFHGRPIAGVAMVAADPSVVAPARGGFWIQQAGRRIFVVVAQSSGVQPQDDHAAAVSVDAAPALEVRPGQRVQLSGRIYPGTMASQVATGLDTSIRSMVAGQPVFLLAEPHEVKPADAEGAGESPSPSPERPATAS